MACGKSACASTIMSSKNATLIKVSEPSKRTGTKCSLMGLSLCDRMPPRVPSALRLTTSARGFMVFIRQYSMVKQIPSRIPLAIAGAIARVAINVIIPMTAPERSTFQAFTKGEIRIKPNTAIITMTASTACGRWYRYSVKNNSTATTARALMIANKPVLAPVFAATAERENEPLTVYEPKKLPIMLARPWPTSSLLVSTRSPVVVAMALEIDVASMKPIKAITSAAGNSAKNRSHWISGTAKWGRPCGMSPTTAPPADRVI